MLFINCATQPQLRYEIKASGEALAVNCVKPVKEKKLRKK